MSSGVVAASDGIFKDVDGFPTERALASEVKELLGPTQGKILCDELPRCQEVGKLTKFGVVHGKRAFKGVKNTYSVVDAEGEPLDGIHIVDNPKLLGVEIAQQRIGIPGNLLGMAGRVIVKDKDEKPLIIARQETFKINKTYCIMGKKPLLDTDESKEKEGDVPFYPWFKIHDIDDSHLDFRSLLIWNGNNYQTYMRIVGAKPGDGLIAPKAIRAPSIHDLLLVAANNQDQVFALFSKKEISDRMAGWDTLVAPGTDVGMCMVLSVLLDDMVGWFA